MSSFLRYLEYERENGCPWTVPSYCNVNLGKKFTQCGALPAIVPMTDFHITLALDLVELGIIAENYSGNLEGNRIFSGSPLLSLSLPMPVVDVNCFLWNLHRLVSAHLRPIPLLSFDRSSLRQFTRTAHGRYCIHVWCTPSRRPCSCRVCNTYLIGTFFMQLLQIQGCQA